MDVENKSDLTYYVKVSHGEDLRRFSFQGNQFKLLEAKLKELFGLAAITVKYLDEEKEWITLASDAELLYAIQLQSRSSQGTPNLRLSVVPNLGFNFPQPSAPPMTETSGNPNPSSGFRSGVPPSMMSQPQVAFQQPMISPYVTPGGNVYPSPQFVPSHHHQAPFVAHHQAPIGPGHQPFSSGHQPFSPVHQQFSPSHHEMKHGGHFSKGFEHGNPHFREEKFKRRHDKATKGALRFVKDVTIEENTKIPPGQTFVKTWRVRNEGTSPWISCALKFKKGTNLANVQFVPVPTVNPGQEVDISLQMVAPKESGKCISVWKMINSNGIPFGQGLKLKIRIPSADSSESSTSSGEENEKKKEKPQWAALEAQYASQLAYLKQMGFNDNKKNLKLLKKFQGNIDQVVVKLLKKINKSK